MGEPKQSRCLEETAEEGNETRVRLVSLQTWVTEKEAIYQGIQVEAGRGKGMASSQSPKNGTQHCQSFNFSLERPILAFKCKGL